MAYFVDRNVNLEEIGSEAFLGVPFLEHQTLGQKIILGVSVLTGMGMFFVSSFLLHLNNNLAALTVFLPIILGVLFGGNYNQDFSLARYFLLKITKPFTKLSLTSTEDIGEINLKLADVKRQNQEVLEHTEMTEEDKKRSIMKLVLILGLLAVVLIAGLVVVPKLLPEKAPELHHTVGFVGEVYYG